MYLRASSVFKMFVKELFLEIGKSHVVRSYPYLLLPDMVDMIRSNECHLDSIYFVFFLFDFDITCNSLIQYSSLENVANGVNFKALWNFIYFIGSR